MSSRKRKYNSYDEFSVPERSVRRLRSQFYGDRRHPNNFGNSSNFGGVVKTSAPSIETSLIASNIQNHGRGEIELHGQFNQRNIQVIIIYHY